MKKVMIKKVMVSLTAMAMMFSFTSVAYGDTEYKPALFDFAGKDLKAKIDSSLTNTATVLYCQSDIDVNGAAKVSRCYDQAKNAPLARNVESAISGLKFTPALVDGKAVPVRMSYRIALNTNSADLIPNLGTMQSRFGRDYIAPQERLDVSDWYAKYSSDSWVNGGAFLGEGDLSRVAATVDEEGEPAVVHTIESKRAYKRDATIVKNALRRSRFIPGFVDNKPVPMGYLAVVNYGDGNEAVGSR